jgi:hypothetical protein
MRWVWHVACAGERRGVYRGNLREINLLEGLEDNIKMDLQEVS